MPGLKRKRVSSAAGDGDPCPAETETSPPRSDDGGVGFHSINVDCLAFLVTFLSQGDQFRLPTVAKGLDAVVYPAIDRLRFGSAVPRNAFARVVARCSNAQSIHMEHCVNLTSLDDLGPLPRQLESFELAGCPLVSDLDALAACTELTNFAACQCENLVSVQGLFGCTNMQQVVLFNLRKLTSVVALDGCTKLQGLTVRLCAGVTDGPSRGVLTDLCSVDLAGCDWVTDGAFLRGCRNLTHVSFYACNSMGHLDLTNFPRLTKVSVYYCRRLAGVAGLGPSTQWLSVSGCSQLASISATARLSGLQEATLWECPLLHDLPVFSPATKVRYVRWPGDQGV